jgi:uroporphyrinogen-III decarboxylase
MHGRLRDNLEHVAAMCPHALEPIECLPYGTADVTLAEVKGRIGDRICLMGNIQEALLHLGTPQEVEAQVRQAIDEGAADGGLILIPTDVAFTPLTAGKADNLMAFLRAGHRFGCRGLIKEEKDG